MSNEVIARPAAFAAMQTDIQVSMDDVVSAFVSQYENNLYSRKSALSKDIRKLEQESANNQEKLLKTVTGEEYKGETLPFGLSYTVSSGAVDWKEKQIKFAIEVKEKGANSRWSSTISVSMYKKIPAAFIKEHNRINDELAVLRAELSEVLMSLKTVARKERQVRGRIAIRKLEDSGYADLMKDAELIKLVQIDEE